MSAPNPAAGAPLRVLQVGAGLMGRNWLRTLASCPDVELAGLVDLDTASAAEALAETGHTAVPIGTTVSGLAESVQPDFVLNVTVPAAHHPVTLESLRLGLPVLGEKPLADSLEQAMQLVAAAETHNRLFMVSQSRRYEPHLFTFRDQVGGLGRLGILATEFFRAPRFGGFRDTMDHPLVLDMAIHAFDTARFVTGAGPVAVYCEEYNPAWSWYGGDAAATAVFEMDGGIRFSYTGSWCSDGHETSWNGSWRASAEHGTARWDGDHAPVVDAVSGTLRTAAAAGPHDGLPAGASGIDAALREFAAALRTGATPMGECHDNLASLAMVYAAIASATERRRITVADLLARAHERARRQAPDDVRAALDGWTALLPPGVARSGPAASA